MRLMTYEYKILQFQFSFMIMYVTLNAHNNCCLSVCLSVCMSRIYFTEKNGIDHFPNWQNSLPANKCYDERKCKYTFTGQFGVVDSMLEV